MILLSAQRKFACSNCPRTYKYQASLYNHARFECGKKPAFACSLCPYKAKRKHCLKDHLKNLHNMEQVVLKFFRPGSDDSGDN